MITEDAHRLLLARLDDNLPRSWGGVDGVDGEDGALGAKASRHVGNDLRVLDGSRVDGDLVGSGAEEGVSILCE